MDGAKPTLDIKDIVFSVCADQYNYEELKRNLT